MDEISLSELEKVCVHAFAKAYQYGEPAVEYPLGLLTAEGLELDEGTFVATMEALEQLGVIEDNSGTDDRYSRIIVTPTAVELSRRFPD
jgi:hypothetical protein